jgi:hypothetical protein
MFYKSPDLDPAKSQCYYIRKRPQKELNLVSFIKKILL